MNTDNKNPKYRNNKNRKYYNKKKKKNVNKSTTSTPRTKIRLLPSEKIYNDWQNLVSRQILARKKYYDAFGSENKKHILKLKNSYEKILSELDLFEAKIPDQIKDKFQQLKFSFKEDLIYSEHKSQSINTDTNEEVSPIDQEKVAPHFLASQAETDFSNDQLESSGSIEDYNKYKGI